ncbi:MAG TPA: cytochrome P450 [Thermomonospora sp.]|nr:cytochrome P450 [Thermomonospora sp.]
MDVSGRSPLPPPTRRSDPFHPPEGFAALRQGPPVRVRLPSGRDAWLVSRYADARAVLADPRFSADDSHPEFPRRSARPATSGGLSFLRMDDPDHGRLRRMLTSEFTVRRITAMRPGILRVVTGLLDELERGSPPVDLVERFALPLPSLVICRLLGVPYEDHAFFQSRSMTILSTSVAPERAAAGFAELAAYLDRLVAAREREPTDDLLGRLAARHVATGALGRAELVAIARLLLIAGHETTANMLALSVLTLLRHPAQLAALRADPSLIRPAVEELLRFLSVVQNGVFRVTREPVEVGGARLEAGEGVVVALPSANRDAGHYRDPDTLDIRRPNGHHLAFGHGAHQCLGQTLARVELEIALTELLARFPALDLAAPLEDLRFRDDITVYGVYALPVRW